MQDPAPQIDIEQPLPGDRELRWELPIEPDERVLAKLSVDLDSSRNYSTGLAVLTERRFLILEAPREHAHSRGTICGKRTYEADLGQVSAIQFVDHRSYVELQVLSPNALLYCVYSTAKRRGQFRDFASLSGSGLTDLKNNGQISNLAIGGPSKQDGERAVSSPPPVKSLWRLSRFARTHIGAILLGLLLAVASTAAGLVPPYLTMPLMDRVLVPFQAGHQVDLTVIWWYLAGLLAAAACAWLLGWGKSLVLARVGEQISADLRNDTFAHMQGLSLDFFGRKRTGDLISRIGSDTDRICTFLSITLVDFGTDLIMIVLTAVTLLSINKSLAVVTLIPFPFVAWLILEVRVRLRRGFARGSSAWAEMVNVLADTIPGIRVVKAFAQEQREIRRFQHSNDRVFDANNRVNTLWALFGPTVTLSTDLGLLVIWGFGAWSITHQRVTVGVLTSFIAFIGRLYARLDSMSRMLASMQRAAASTYRLFEILDSNPTVAEVDNPLPMPQVEGRIEFRNVGFQYGTREVLHDITLTIEPGEMVGVVGPSGAGKSTLINLVCRFYDVSAGGLFIDGKDIRSLGLEAYRRHIGIVLQDPFLFYGTVAENIAYGRPNASKQEIIAAARASRAHDFIMRLPFGYDSLVGERGQSLSGGERQRISIARALLTDPRILILDEATSSVDSETELEIQLALENLVRGRTTIAIAHRLSTLRKADRLIVLEGGRITACGRHDELLRDSATYAALCRAQYQGLELLEASADG